MILPGDNAKAFAPSVHCSLCCMILELEPHFIKFIFSPSLLSIDIKSAEDNLGSDDFDSLIPK